VWRGGGKLDGGIGGQDSSAHGRPAQSASSRHSPSAHSLEPATPVPQKQSSPRAQSLSVSQASETQARTIGPGFGFPGPTIVGVSAHRACLPWVQSSSVKHKPASFGLTLVCFGAGQVTLFRADAGGVVAAVSVGVGVEVVVAAVAGTGGGEIGGAPAQATSNTTAHTSELPFTPRYYGHARELSMKTPVPGAAPERGCAGVAGSTPPHRQHCTLA
jgi:hypothetical protein